MGSLALGKLEDGGCLWCWLVDPWDLSSAALRGWLCPGDMECKALGLPVGLVGMD